MSASREKRMRKDLRDSGPGLNAKERQQQQDRRRRTIVAIIAAAVVVTVLVLIVAGSGMIPANMAAVTIDGVAVKGAELDFHYYSIAMQNISEYESYGLLDYLELNPYASYKRQKMAESDIMYLNMLGFDSGKEYKAGETWADYFEERAVQSLTSVIVQSEAAKREGITLDEADEEQINIYIASIENAAAQRGLTPDRYLRENYGRGIKLESYRAALERVFLADRYTAVTVESFGWTDEDLEAHYRENRTAYDLVDYHRFVIDKVPEDLDSREEPYTDEEKETYGESQKAKANAMLARVTDSESFFALSCEYSETDDHDDHDGHDHDANEDTTLVMRSSASSLNGDLAEFILDENRKSGDKTVLESEENFTVILFLKRSRDESPDTKEGVKALADKIYAEWLAGAADEDSFAKLAREHSADSNSARGGIYEGVYQGQMVTEFNDWCLDPERKPGDSGIVETQHGQHIMFFIRTNEEDSATVDIRHILIKAGGWKAAVKSDLDSKEYSERFNMLTEGITTRRHWFTLLFTKSV